MRKASAIFVAPIVTLAVLTAPVLAKNSGAQRTDESKPHRPATPTNRIPMDHGSRFHAGSWVLAQKRSRSRRTEAWMKLHTEQA